jgi:hypothetical protein
LSLADQRREQIATDRKERRETREETERYEWILSRKTKPSLPKTANDF